MVVQARTIEKRRFGRRKLTCHAWIKIGRKQPQACTVRNISTHGALLEFEGDAPLASQFLLLVEDPSFKAKCEVKHRRPHAIGVYFVEAMDVVAPSIDGGAGNKLVAGLRAAQVNKP